MLMAFTAIQMAGPDLTPQNAQRGLESFTAAYQPPLSPHAGYGPGDHAFLDDFMIERWDPSAPGPQGSGNGCMRLMNGGRRYLEGVSVWPADDRAADDFAGEPCQPSEVMFEPGVDTPS
jgi:hypothetical protein